MTPKKKKNKDPKPIVVYDNNYMEALYQTDYLAKKIMIAASLRCQDMNWKPEGCEIVMSSNELRELSGITKNSLKNIEPAIDKLHKTIIKIRDIHDNNHYMSFTFLPKGEYDNGKLTLLINSEMKPLIHNLQKNFTKYHIENIKPLKSGYSIRIFELLKMSAYKGKYRIKIEELRKMFGIEDKYEKYNDFKKDVIEKAKSELKEHCDIYFEYKEIKEGNRVTEIEFEIFNQRKSFSDYEDVIEATVKQIELQEYKSGKSHLETELNEIGWRGDFNELTSSVKIEAIEYYLKTIKRNLQEVDTKNIEPTKLSHYIDGMLRQSEKFYELYQACLSYDPVEEKKKSELARKLMKLGFTGDPEKFIEEEGRELIEEALKILEKQSNITNIPGLLREKVKSLKIQREILKQEIAFKKEKEEAERAEFIEKQRLQKQAAILAAQKDKEADEKYSGHLPEFYEHYRSYSHKDPLKNEFINEFKQKFVRKEITKYSELGGIVQNCFLEWYAAKNK